jgi:hypothetical protein
MPTYTNPSKNSASYSYMNEIESAAFSYPSKNSAAYSNMSENISSVMSFLLTEDGYYLNQQNDSHIGLEQDYQFSGLIKRESVYSNLSKA